MDTEIPPAEEANRGMISRPPRLAHWLWRPWYARVWWAGASLYWLGKLGSYWSEGLNAVFTTALAGYLNVAFFPPAIILVLANGFLWPWMQYHGWERCDPTHEEICSKRSDWGYRHIDDDPFDIRSIRNRNRQKLP
jgi:hypothetical protein